MAYVGLDRGIVDHWIYQDAEYFKVWFEMLYRARFATEPTRELVDGELVAVNYGEFIYGRNKWCERLKIGEQRLRTLIKKLVGEEMIVVVSQHRKCTVYRIVKYAEYNNPVFKDVFKDESISDLSSPSKNEKINQQTNQQNIQSQQGFEDDANQHANQRLTSSQPAANQQLTTKEERKNDKNEKNYKPLKDIVPFSEIIDYLNLKARTNFKSSSKATQRHIGARWKEGHGMTEFQTVIDKKTAEWIEDPKMSQYLRPETLFGTKFESYLNQTIVLRGGQANATKSEHSRYASASEHYANDAQGSAKSSIQSAASGGSHSVNSEFDLDQFVRR